MIISLAMPTQLERMRHARRVFAFQPKSEFSCMMDDRERVNSIRRTGQTGSRRFFARLLRFNFQRNLALVSGAFAGSSLMKYEGSPMAGQAPPGWAKKILHAGLASGDGVWEGCDAPPWEYKKPQSFCVMLRPKDAGWVLSGRTVRVERASAVMLLE
jgi:hypothetical protein